MRAQRLVRAILKGYWYRVYFRLTGRRFTAGATSGASVRSSSVGRDCSRSAMMSCYSVG
jgi:hypothetical protein